MLVLGPDGRIVQGEGIPRAWEGKRIEHAVGLPAAVLEAADELLERARTSKSWVNRRMVTAGGVIYELLVVEAVPLRRRPTDVREILTRTTELLLEQARSLDVAIQLRIDEHLPPHLVVDGEKLAWGVTTLVGSALRHLSRAGQAGGTVRVRARYSAEPHEVAIIVHDDGPGIPNERLLGILTPGSSVRQSSALALVMLQDVVAAHGGRLEVESSTKRSDHGTTVSLHLPVRR